MILMGIAVWDVSLNSLQDASGTAVWNTGTRACLRMSGRPGTRQVLVFHDGKSRRQSLKRSQQRG